MWSVQLGLHFNMHRPQQTAGNLPVKEALEQAGRHWRDLNQNKHQQGMWLASLKKQRTL